MAIFTALFGAIGSAIGAISTFVGGLGAVGSFVLKTVVGIGLNLLAKAIAGKPKGPQFSVNGKIQSGGDVPRSFLIGWAATAGSLVYANTWGNSGKTPNAYLTQVIALSDIPIQSLQQVMVNGELCTLDGAPDSAKGYPVLEYRKNSVDHLWVKFYDGTQTTADSFLTGTVSSTDRPYESTRVGNGVAYVICTSLINQELFTGFPTFKFSCTGVKLYDPSKDTTAGGSGSQRWATPSTWGGDGDHLPAVQILNLLRGVKYDGKWFYGLQNTAVARTPDAAWISQIAKCRAAIEGEDGDEPTYRTGGEIQVGAPIADAIQALLTGCQGRLAEIGGVYDIAVGSPASSSFSITDADIISTEEQSFTPFYGLADTINGITATVPDPGQLWNARVLPPLYNADYEDEDGGRRLLADVNLDLVPYVAQGQRLMRSALAEARRARRHTFVLPPKFWAYAVPNAVFQWTSTRNGYSTKLFRIDGVADKGNLDVMVDVTEVDPSDFDWDFDTDFTPVAEGALGPLRPPAQAMTGWQVFPATIYDDDNDARRPSIEVHFDGDLNDVREARIAVRLASSEVVVFDSTVPYGDPATNDNPREVILNGVFLPDTDYEVAGKYVPYSGRDTSWSLWLPVTTPDVRLGSKDLYPIDLDDLAADIKEMQAWISDGTRDLIAEMYRVGLSTIDQDAANYQDKQTLRTELRSATDKVTAAYTNAITVATGPSSALAQEITGLTAQVGDAVGAVNTAFGTSATDLAGALTVTSNAIIAVDSSIGDVTASGTFRIETGYTPASGWSSRIGLQTRVDENGTFADAGLFLESKSGQSRILMTADQIIMTDGSALKSPFVFTGGVLYARDLMVDFAKIVNVEITNAEIANATILEGNIAAGAVTNANDGSASGGLTTQTGWVTILSRSISSPSGNPVLLYYLVTYASGMSGITTIQARVRRDGTVLRTFSASATSGQTASLSQSELMMDAVSTGSHTYDIQVTGGIYNTLNPAPYTSTLIMQCNKK